MAKYYPINEELARRAKEARSWSDYKKGSATANYRAMVDEAAEIAERQKNRVDSMYHEKIDALLDRYARRLAENLNRENEISARCPSIMIAGESNFPVGKKQKQIAAWDRNYAEFKEIEKIIDRIKGTGTGGIMSDDKNTIEKLRAKLASLERYHEKMKAVNAFYRKHKTLEGCPALTPDEIEEAKIEMAKDWHFEDKPFPTWELSNNSANMRRIKGRIADLEREAARAAEASEKDEPEQGDGYILKENHEIGRIQFVFDGKPDEVTRALLKSYGFKWAPSQSAWQRMLNDNGRRAAESVKAKL